jgi:hypothetical protein
MTRWPAGTRDERQGGIAADSASSARRKTESGLRRAHSLGTP